jgi:phosphoglycerate kinase
MTRLLFMVNLPTNDLPFRMKKVKTIRDVALKGKLAFVRVDFNVPSKTERSRMTPAFSGAIPTIKYLVEKGAKVVLVQSPGSPQGKEESRVHARPGCKGIVRRAGHACAIRGRLHRRFG